MPEIGKNAFETRKFFIHILGQVNKKDYPKWKNIRKIDDLFIGYNYYLNIILKIVSLLLVLVGIYYMGKSNMILGIITLIGFIIKYRNI